MEPVKVCQESKVQSTKYKAQKTKPKDLRLKFHDRLLPRVVLRHKPLLQQAQVSLFKIEVCPGDYFFSVIRCHPIDNLRCICSEISSIVLIQRLAVFSRENPNISKLTVADVLEVFFETSQGRSL